MKAFFKILSLLGLILTSVIFSFVLYGVKTLPNEIHLIENEKINVNGIYSFNVSKEAAALSLNTNNDFYSLESDKKYSLDISLFKKIPVKSTSVTISKRKYVIPVGDVFGIRLFTSGVVVVGTDNVYTADGAVNPADKAGIKPGDIVTAINGEKIEKVKDFTKFLQTNQSEKIILDVMREEKTFTAELNPVMSKNDNNFKVGLWIRDSMAGVGTITYYDENSGIFGGLGHAVCDVDTGIIMPLSNGDAVNTVIGGCYKGTSGATGELCGVFQQDDIGSLLKNCSCGIFGTLDKADFTTKNIPVATKQEVKTGKAQIISTVDDQGPQYYDIKIVKIFSNESETSKNMIIEVADSNLISKTGGIVQGMSGSPIIQNGMLVGAVTHVFVNNPLQGYAIFADTMIEISNDLAQSELKEAS